MNKKKYMVLFSIKKIVQKSFLCSFLTKVIGFLKINKDSFLALIDCIVWKRMKVLFWNDRYFFKKLKQQLFTDLRGQLLLPTIHGFYG